MGSAKEERNLTGKRQAGEEIVRKILFASFGQPSIYSLTSSIEMTKRLIMEPLAAAISLAYSLMRG